MRTCLPGVADRGLEARIIAGTALSARPRRSPACRPWFYAEVKIAAGRSAPLDNDYEERAIYVVDGEVEIAGDIFEGPQLLIFRPGDRITIIAKTDCRAMFLGGAALEGPRYIWWNFVSSSKERIESAKEDWKQGRFAAVPEESEFIPLPE